MNVGLRTRLVLTTSLVLLVGLLLGGWVLVRSFSASVVTGAEEQLRLVVYGLLGGADLLDGSLSFSSDFAEPRFSAPESGLYALVEDATGGVIWQSPSLQMTGATPASFATVDAPGRFEFGADEQFFYSSYQVIWEDADEALLTFRVFTARAPYIGEIAGFRRTLTMGGAGLILSLILAQYLAVAWGLRPVNVMASRVQDLENGQRRRLGTDFPAELTGLARNLDRFIEHEATSRDRYRRAMDDLAHSLKTPLAVLRNGMGDTNEPDELLAEQLNRMESTVAYQLSRAVAAPSPIMADKLSVDESVTRILGALRKAYADKSVSVEQAIDVGYAVRADERDLLEVLGNLLENAFKYATSSVRVSANRRGANLEIVVEDDGGGIDAAERERVLARGVRADSATPGQGIGLAVVVELLAGYGSRLQIDSADLGGARISFELPAA